MFRRKYGRMTFSAWLNVETEQTRLPCAVLGGILLSAACIAIRIASGTPYRVILELGIADLLPPVWLLSMLRLLSFLTVGCAAGLVLGWRERGCQAEKYRGCMLFILLATVELCIYPTLFGAGAVFLTLIESLLALLLCICVTVSFLRVSKLAGFIMVLHCVWSIYMLVLIVSVFFRN